MTIYDCSKVKAKREWTEEEIEEERSRLKKEQGIWFAPKTLRWFIDHGYVPPPKPVPVREQIAETVSRSWLGGEYGKWSFFSNEAQRSWLRVADAILDRFNVTPKEQV